MPPCLGDCLIMGFSCAEPVHVRQGGVTMAQVELDRVTCGLLVSRVGER